MSLAALFAMISNKWVVMSNYDSFHGGKTKNSMGIWVSFRQFFNNDNLLFFDHRVRHTNYAIFLYALYSVLSKKLSFFGSKHGSKTVSIFFAKISAFFDHSEIFLHDFKKKNFKLTLAGKVTN